MILRSLLIVATPYRAGHDNEICPEHCRTLQNTATHCNTLQHIATGRTTLQHTAMHCNIPLQEKGSSSTTRQNRQDRLQHTATHCNTLQHTISYCNELQHTLMHYNKLQPTAIRCNTQHPTTTYWNIETYWNILRYTIATATSVAMSVGPKRPRH